MHDYENIARKALRTSDDRMRNYIELDGERVDLAPQATLEEAKAQWADALWLLTGLVREAYELGKRSAEPWIDNGQPDMSSEPWR